MSKYLIAKLLFAQKILKCKNKTVVKKIRKTQNDFLFQLTLMSAWVQTFLGVCIFESLQVCCTFLSAGLLFSLDMLTPEFCWGIYVFQDYSKLNPLANTKDQNPQTEEGWGWKGAENPHSAGR